MHRRTGCRLSSTAPAPLIISTSEEGYLTIRLDSFMIDLMLTSDGDPSPFKDNFITSPAGVIEIRCDKILHTHHEAA